MVNNSQNPDIPLVDEIDLERSKNHQTRQILVVMILFAVIASAAVWWWKVSTDSGGKPSLKAMFLKSWPGKKSSSSPPSVGLTKKPPIYKTPLKVSNLSILKTGKDFYEKEELDKAEAEFTKGMLKKDHQEIVINNLGVVLFSKGKLIESAAMFKKALETDPFFPDAHFNLAYVSEKMGNRNRSLYHYRRFLEFSEERHASLARKLKKRIGL